MRLRATGRKQVKRETITVNTYKNLPASTGFTLTEVLVALLVLGIGLLGLAALQARGVKFNHDANARSQATLLAYQIMDQMRADAASMASYCTDSTACPSTYATPSSDPASACNLASSSVQNTIDCWMAAVREVLPAGDGEITTNTTGGDTKYDVIMKWQERGARNPTSQQECESIAHREWDAGNSICRITQTWTVM